MVVTVALWIDQLWNGRIAHFARLAFVYKPVFIIVLVVSTCVNYVHARSIYIPQTAFGPLADDGN